MNRWFTFRQRNMRIYDGEPRVYRVSLYAVDRAGNKPAKVGSARLVVKKRASRRRTAQLVDHHSVSARSAGAARFAMTGPRPAVQRLVLPAWLSEQRRELVARLVERAE